MLLPRAMMLALTADCPPPAQPVTARVGSPEGEVGVVESVVYAADTRRPAAYADEGW